MAKKEKSWQKRLNGSIDQLAVEFVESLSYDKRLYKYDIAGSIAHAKMLAEQKIITKTEFNQIRKGLKQIESQFEEGKFKFDNVYEDIHMAIEADLINRIGDAGKKLHTGRSRNDQVATDIRLWMRDEIDVVVELLKNVQKAFVKLAQKYCNKVMPAYTHLQRAQPIVTGSYLLSFVEQFERDIKRLSNCRELLNVSPLGCGAVAGSTLPLDRRMTAKQLGFKDITYNSIDATSDRDFCAEFIFACSMVSVHLSRLAEDWIIYSSSEFNFIRVDDRYCTSSSMMPQKRNPDMLELIRGHSATLYGCLTSMMTLLKAQPSSYNRDIQTDKLHVFRAADTIEACLRITEAIVKNTSFNVLHIESTIDKGYLEATVLAEYLVGKGIAFRQAHGIVGTIVAECEKQGISLSSMDMAQFSSVCREIESDVYEYLSAKNVPERYITEGAASPAQTKKRVQYWNRKLGGK